MKHKNLLELIRLAVFIAVLFFTGTGHADMPVYGVVIIDTTGAGHSQFVTQDGANPGSGHIRQDGVGGHSATIDQGAAADPVDVTANIHQEGDDASHTAIIFQDASVSDVSVADIYQAGAANTAGIDTTGDDGLLINQGQRAATSTYGNDATITATGINTGSRVQVDQDGVMNHVSVSLADTDSAAITVDQGGSGSGVAHNSVTLSVVESDGAFVDVLQSGGARNVAKVDAEDNRDSPFINLSVTQSNESNLARTVVKRNYGPISSSIMQDGTGNEAVSRTAENVGAFIDITQTAGSSDNLGRVIIENSEFSRASVTQQGKGGEANVIIDNTRESWGTIDQRDGSGSYANIALRGGGESEVVVTQEGDAHAATVQFKGDIISEASVNQSGHEHSITVKVNNSLGATVDVNQSGTSHSALAKVRGDSHSTQLSINQGYDSGAGRDNRADVSVRRDDGWSLINLDQGLSDNKATVILDTISVTADITQLGYKNDADLIVRNANASTARITQTGSDNVALNTIDADDSTQAIIAQTGDGNNAAIVSAGGVGHLLGVSQSGNGNSAAAEVISTSGEVVIDIVQQDNGNASVALVSGVEAGIISIAQSGGGRYANVSHTNASDNTTTSLVQSGHGNSAMVSLEASKGNSLQIMQTGQDGTVELSLSNSDNIMVFDVNQGGVGNSVTGLLSQTDVEEVTIDQSDITGNNNAIEFSLNESDGLTLSIAQAGDSGSVVFNAADSVGSMLRVGQSGSGSGRTATIEFNDADTSIFTIEQNGFDNNTNVLLSGVSNVTGNLVQGGYGNVMDVSITTSGDNFDSTDPLLAIDQTRCFECTAVYSN